MKKLLSLTLVLFTVLSLFSCTGKEITPMPIATTKAESTTAPTDQLGSEPIQPEPDVPFYAGYAKINISPDRFPILMFGGTPAKRINDDLFLTVVAVSDGENKALFISLDLQSASGTILTRALNTAEKYGVPRENVLVNATHNHSGVHSDALSTYAGQRWCFKTYKAIEEGIKTALEDLSATTAEIAKIETPPLNHVRRYYMKDGTTSGIQMPDSQVGYDRHESEADRELQAIRFCREDKKDIVMVNWQAHAAHAVGFLNDAITADFVHYFREGVEEKYDVLFAYYQGACGNINFDSYVHGGKSSIIAGMTLVDVLGEALENAEPAKLGKINTEMFEYTATVDHSTDKYYDRAIEARTVFNDYKALYGKEMTNNELYKQFKFYSKYHIYSIINRYNSEKTIDIPISAISFGDISFASTPYEMFDTNGMQVKDGSPFKMTFMCAYTNGHYGYVPSTNVYNNGGYEVYTTRFIKGTGDDVAAKLIEMLKAQYTQNN